MNDTTTHTTIHFHKCPDCGHIWGHAEDRKNNEEAHTCQRCGTMQWMKFNDMTQAAFGDRDPHGNPKAPGWEAKIVKPRKPRRSKHTSIGSGGGIKYPYESRES